MVKTGIKKSKRSVSVAQKALKDYYSNPTNVNLEQSVMGVPVHSLKQNQMGMYINIMYLPDPDDYSSIEATVDKKLDEYNCVKSYVAQDGYKAYICIAYADTLDVLERNEKKIAENVYRLCGGGTKVYILTKTRDGIRLERQTEVI